MLITPKRIRMTSVQPNHEFFVDAKPERLRCWILKTDEPVCERSNTIEFETNDGEIQQCELTKTVILHFLAKVDNIAGNPYKFKQILRLGYDVIAFDYTGFTWGSKHIATIEQMMKDGVVMYRYICRYIDPHDIVLYGDCTGALCSSYLNMLYPCKCHMIIRAYSKPSDVNYIFPKLIGDLFDMLHPVFQLDQYLKKSKNPVILVHSLYDEIVPFESMQKNYDNIKNVEKHMIKAEGYHVSLYYNDTTIEEIREKISLY